MSAPPLIGVIRPGARILFAACALSLAVPTLAAAKTYMSQEELLATLPGATVESVTTEGTKWSQTYSAYNGSKKKGTIDVVFGGEAMTSKWYLNGNQWCENWGSGKQCWEMERLNDKQLMPHGDGKKHNPWVLR